MAGQAPVPARSGRDGSIRWLSGAETGSRIQPEGIAGRSGAMNDSR